MTIIRVKNKNVLSMPYLIRAVLKYIYEQESMTWAEVEEMRRSVVNWHKAIRIENDKLATIQGAELKLFGQPLTTEHKYSEVRHTLDAIGKLLRDNEDGRLDHRKRLFKEKDIDYKKFHRLPESYTEEGLHLAQEEKKKYDKKHPEQEGLV